MDPDLKRYIPSNRPVTEEEIIKAKMRRSLKDGGKYEHAANELADAFVDLCMDMTLEFGTTHEGAEWEDAEAEEVLYQHFFWWRWGN